MSCRQESDKLVGRAADEYERRCLTLVVDQRKSQWRALFHCDETGEFWEESTEGRYDHPVLRKVTIDYVHSVYGPLPQGLQTQCLHPTGQPVSYPGQNEAESASSKRDRVVRLVDEITTELRGRLQQTGGNPMDMPTRAMVENLLAQVQNMRKHLSPAHFQPTYARMLIDSWDIHDNLGERLLSLLHLYKQLP